jgi:hypothetical protein
LRGCRVGGGSGGLRVVGGRVWRKVFIVKDGNKKGELK